MKIAVVGAGLAGLTAALRFRQAGHDVQVLETRSSPGGRCKALHRDGYIIDTCAEFAATNYRRWLALIHEVGLGAQVVKCSSVVSVLQQGRLFDLDMANPLSLLSTPALSWGAKLRLLRGFVRLRPRLRSAPQYLLDDVSLDDAETTAAVLSLGAFGGEVTDRLIEPLLRPLSGVALDLASAMLVPYVLADQIEMITLRGGLDSLPRKLAASLKVSYETTVNRVHTRPEGVTIEVADAHGVARTLTVDKCLITVPLDQAEEIFPRFRELDGPFREKMEYLRALDVKLAYARAPGSKAAMVVMSPKESPDINVIFLSHNKAPDRAPAGSALFSIFTEHQSYDTMAAMSDAHVVAEVRRQVEQLYPEIRGHFLFSYVARETRCSYIPRAGYFRRAKALWDAVGIEPRVQLSGDIFMFGGLEAAVASGERAAARLLQS